MEYVVETAERAGLFDGDQIVRFLDNTDDRAVAFWVGTIETWIDIGEIVADGAENDLFLYLAQRAGKVIDLGRGAPEHIKSQPLR